MIIFADTIINPGTVMVPLVYTSLTLVAVPTAPRLDNITFEADVDVVVLAHFLHQLYESVFFYLVVDLCLNSYVHQAHYVLFFKKLIVKHVSNI